jgi:hypothetical protein
VSSEPVVSKPSPHPLVPFSCADDVYSGGTPIASSKGLRDARTHRLLSLANTNVLFPNLLAREKALAQEVSSWSCSWEDGGATHWYRLTRADPFHTPPTNAWDLCWYIANASPKIRYLCRILYNSLYAYEPKRKLIIFSNWPLEQWLIVCFLKLMGIATAEIRSNMDNEEKAENAARFDNRHDETMVLVSSFKASGVGLNLQHACFQIVMMAFPENINSLLQAVGRAHRLGQEHEQYIWILCCDHTYDQILQAKIANKMLAQIIGEAQLQPLQVTSQLQAEIRQGLDKRRHPDDPPVSDIEVGQEISRLSDEHLEAQADQILCKVVGFRCSRRFWNSPELDAKDSLADYQEAPCRIRDWKPVNEEERSRQAAHQSETVRLVDRLAWIRGETRLGQSNKARPGPGDEEVQIVDDDEVTVGGEFPNHGFQPFPVRANLSSRPFSHEHSIQATAGTSHRRPRD